MKKTTILVLSAFAVAMAARSQSAIDAYQLAQPDFRGTARYMSMGGAFGALGGDVSTLNNNPGGIGVYRSSDIAFTLDINMMSTKTESSGQSFNNDRTKVYVNNFGYVGSAKTGSSLMPVFNWGASYSRVKSFDRAYHGALPSMGTSLTNYVAGYTSGQWSQQELYGPVDGYNPYKNSYAPWMSVLFYNSCLINPQNAASSNYSGLYRDGAVVNGEFDVIEKGYVDEYSINLGGNFVDMVYWGIGFGITDISYTSDTYYSESVSNTRVPQKGASGFVDGSGAYALRSLKHISGSGFNFKAGVIVKPINELRLGLAVSTPTYYSLSQEGQAYTSYSYSSGLEGVNVTNNNNPDYFRWKFNTPWRLIASVAGVIGSKGIISMDYEYQPYNKMTVKDDSGRNYTDIDNDIKDYYQASSILRVGGEYKVIPMLALRAGYSYQSSPVKSAAYHGELPVYTAGPDDTETQPSYSMDNTIQHITLGLGLRVKRFYADAAYVHTMRESEFRPFTPGSEAGTPPASKITDSNNSIVLTVGYKF